MSEKLKLQVPAIKVNQWLEVWDEIVFNNDEKRKKPQPYFYIFTLRAETLRKLSQVYQRKTDAKRYTDWGPQRGHDPERSFEISEFISGGYPWSDLAEVKRKSNEYRDLKMPGWLPTSIVANILPPDSIRSGKKIKSDDLIKISEKGDQAFINLPRNLNEKTWVPEVPPIEIIDGQHRLWAFDSLKKVEGQYEFPVVAFEGLDETWQAYLFYVINIKPKRINASLAFDLYPLLRTQEWLEKAPGQANVYRETRAQEIVETLWAHPKSKWRGKINMLGETKQAAPITQASFVRNLTASLIKGTTTKRLGGLFAAKLPNGAMVNWSRPQQAAFVIYIWNTMHDEFIKCDETWLKQLIKQHSKSEIEIPFEEKKEALSVFFNKFSLIATDQGVRGFLHVINDMVYLHSNLINLNEIFKLFKDQEIGQKKNEVDEEVSEYLSEMGKSSLSSFIKKICKELTLFDWRTSSEPSLGSSQRLSQMVFKGSSGYKELRKQLMEILGNSKEKEIANTAAIILFELGYER